MKIKDEYRDMYVGRDGKRNSDTDPLDLLALELELDKKYFEHRYEYDKYQVNRWNK